MLSIIRKFLNKFRPPKFDRCEICQNPPYHIAEIAKLYPVIHTLVKNKSKGEISKFVLEQNALRVGQALILNHDREIWIHLGNDYFKNIVKL